jgi:REP element-mobilizing transposase RayT
MPRTARLDAAGILHHVIIRGIEKRSIFRGAADKDWFVQRLGALVQGSNTGCYAWALMTNHVHVLLRTGDMSLSTLMRRLLTGYAGYFNRRHGRHGQLFQNRYKSIICQEDIYLKELVRYIHLNPLRAGLVATLEDLKSYEYSGHSALMGERSCSWQQTGNVLELFGIKEQRARQQYSKYVAEGIAQGRRPELVGGGLIRSMGGWEALKKLRQKGQDRVKGDARILGEGGFVEQVLARAEEKFSRRHELKRRGYDIDKVEQKVCRVCGIALDELRNRGREKQRVEARSLAIYWAVRELGIDGMSLARRYHLTQSAIVHAVRRGEKIAKEMNCQLSK